MGPEPARNVRVKEQLFDMDGINSAVIKQEKICSLNKLAFDSSNKSKSKFYRKLFVLNKKRRKLSTQLLALREKNPFSPKTKQKEE